MLICDGHNNPDWDEQNDTYSKSQQQSIPGQMNRVTMICQLKFGDMNIGSLLLDDEHPNCGHTYEGSKVPA